MLFNTRAFAVFYLAVFCAYWLLRRRERPRHLLLLAASYYFYAYWDERFLALLGASTLLDYFVARALGSTSDARRRKQLVLVSLVGQLGMLAFFKYYNFFAAEMATMLSGFGVVPDELLLDVVLPVGISFYTFQTLSYTLDVYRRTLEPERDLLRFCLFVAFFPQLIAGPIVRATHFLPQLRVAPRLDQRTLESSLALICWGLVKKVVIADYLGSALVDPFWERPETYGGWASLLGIYGYAFQIYGDFSGYSDIAIGTARLLGFDLGKNFQSPYRATSPREFWTRWHISLSSWLRDYLYIPLGGSRGGNFKTYRNLMLTMLLGGLWHGASWMFVAWGALHGLLLVVDRLLGLAAPRAALDRWLRRAILFQLVCLAWVLFRSADGAIAARVLGSLATERGPATIGTYVWIVLGLAVLTHFPTSLVKQRLREVWVAVPAPLQGVAYALLIGLLMNAEALKTPFIYFQF